MERVFLSGARFLTNFRINFSSTNYRLYYRVCQSAYVQWRYYNHLQQRSQYMQPHEHKTVMPVSPNDPRTSK